MGEPRVWPPGRPLAEAEALPVVCVECSLPWRVHLDLAGGRFACECGTWIQVPGVRPPVALPLHSPVDEPLALLDPGEEVQPYANAHEVDTLHRPERVEEVRGFSSRAILELALLFLAFVIPATVLHFASDPRTQGLLMPLSGLVSGMLVLVIGAFTQGVAFSGLRPARARHLAESVLVVAPMLAFAFLITKLLEAAGMSAEPEYLELRGQLGLGMTLFVVALCPAVFEEVAFRGVVHARCRQLFGPAGIVVTAAAFALAHGLQPFLIGHFGIGLYLSWIRDRSHSLLPGMVTHLLYNGTVVIML